MQDAMQWHDKKLVDANGSKVGPIEEIYVDNETGQPEFALVKTSLFGTNSSFVPIAKATPEGDQVSVPYDSATIKDAPQLGADGELSPTEEAELYRHYGLDYSESNPETAAPEGRSDRRVGDDAAMTRSEEELIVGKAEHEVGRARLRKYVVTENVQQTVPLRREEVRVETEPITDENVDEATSGAPLSDDELEVVVREEQPVVEKRTVPKERVRLAKDEYTEDREIWEQVHKEEIETDGDVSRR